MRRTALLVLACSLLALAAGIYLGGHPSTLPGPIRDSFVEEDRALRSEIVETIQDNFYKPVDDSRLDEPASRTTTSTAWRARRVHALTALDIRAIQFPRRV